jgi:hypothetical protein
MVYIIDILPPPLNGAEYTLISMLVLDSYKVPFFSKVLNPKKDILTDS